MPGLTQLGLEASVSLNRPRLKALCGLLLRLVVEPHITRCLRQAKHLLYGLILF